MITTKPLPLGFLPNKPGFEFIGITKDGKELDCEVKLVDGMHQAYSNGNKIFKELRYWKNT